MFLNYENGSFTKNTYVKPGVYFCTDLLDFLLCIEEGAPASIKIEESLIDALEDGSILSGFSKDALESVYNAIVYE